MKDTSLPYMGIYLCMLLGPASRRHADRVLQDVQSWCQSYTLPSNHRRMIHHVRLLRCNCPKLCRLTSLQVVGSCNLGMKGSRCHTVMLIVATDLLQP